MDWDWLAIAGTAAVGFGAAQLGAFLQFRRDQTAQARRDVVESEREQAQLAAQQKESDAQRRLTESLDWRDRRLEAFSDVATRVEKFTKAMTDVASAVTGHLTQAQSEALVEEIAEAVLRADLLGNSEVIS